MMGIYDTLGIEPVINGWGTVTQIGGSRMDKAVLAAMNEAAGAYVDMHLLHAKAGEKIAEWLGCEAACITSGAAAGLAVAAAACMTRGDVANILQLPDSSGMPSEALVLKCHRILYDQALQLSGATLREVGTTSFACLEQVEAAVAEKTAMFFYVAEAEKMRGSIPFPDIARALGKHHVPLVVDAAAELPPMRNVMKYLEQGADLVIVSGGKELRGPQSSGLILGNKRFVAYCRATNFPNYGIGRSMKVDKETIAGITKAVELFVRKDYTLEMQRWERIVAQFISALSAVSGFSARRGFPAHPGVQPADIPRVYIKAGELGARQLQHRLRERKPAVYLGLQDDEVVMNPQCLEDDEIDEVVRALTECVQECDYAQRQ